MIELPKMLERRGRPRIADALMVAEACHFLETGRARTPRAAAEMAAIAHQPFARRKSVLERLRRRLNERNAAERLYYEGSE